MSMLRCGRASAGSPSGVRPAILAGLAGALVVAPLQAQVGDAPPNGPEHFGGASGPPVRTVTPPAGKTPRAGVRYDIKNGYSLAFVDADVRRVVDAVLGSMLGLDYDVDPKVQGNVTLRTAKPVTADSLIPLLENALATVDAVVVARGDRYQVVSREAARSRAPVASMDSSGVATAGFATEVVTLKNVSAPEMARLLEQFLGKEAVAGTNPASNQIIIAGSGEERSAARAMIARFDVDNLAGMNFALYRLENVEADTLYGELKKIFQPPFDIIGSRVRIVPLPRMRAVLAIAADRADLDRIEPWITRLDAGGSNGKRKLYSYTVQNGRARDLARALQQVMGSGGNDTATTPSAAASTSALATPALGGSGGDAGQSSVLTQATLPLTDPGDVAIVSGSGSGLRIVPNDDTNSLLIYATGEEYDLIREALSKIDRAVAQVLIEATLAEVTLNNNFRAGVDWSFLTGNSSFRLGNTSAGVPTRVFPGFSYAYLGNSAQAVLNTLQSKTNVRVLSAPKLIVLNNQTATLQVGDQVPIVSQQSQSVAAPGAPIVNTIELRDTGVILKVTPRVNDSGAVTLDIAQEVSDVVETTTSGINSPTIQQRRLTSTVSTRSGQMIALGGLIRERRTKGKSGIPLLSQIPIVGAAFGQQTDRNDRTELIILLTPTVVRSPEEVRAMVDDLLSKMDSLSTLAIPGVPAAPPARKP